ncbi:hypothetical protein D3C87_1397810 [compost metagenome]
MITVETIFQNPLTEWCNVMSDLNQTVQSRSNHRINDSNTTTHRDISLIKGQLHLNEVIQKNCVLASSSSNSRSNAVREAVNQIGICIHLRAISLSEKTTFKRFLNSTSSLSSTGSDKSFHLCAIFTEFVSDIPSIADIIGNGKGHFTRFDRRISERNVFSTVLNCDSTNCLDV